MGRMTIIEGNSSEKDNERLFFIKGPKGDQGDLNHNDIVDNLNSNATDKVLSAKQGKELKKIINDNKTEANSTYSTKSELSVEEVERTSADDDLQAQINALSSGAPLVASSTSDMTDTTKVYVNTTDGYWYYYNGSSWIQGGVYQASQIEDGSITRYKLDTEVRSTLFYEPVVNCNWVAGGYSDGTPTTNTKRVRTLTYISTDTGDFYVSAPTGYKFLVVYYKSPLVVNSNFFDHNSEWVNAGTLKLEKGYFARIIAGYSNDAEVVNVSDVSSHISVTQVISKVDTKADKKVVYKDIEVNLTIKTRWVWDDGTDIATTEETNSTNFKTCELDVVEGERYKTTITQGSSELIRCMLFCDSSYNILKVFPEGPSSPPDWVTLTDYEFVIPAGCTKLCLTPAINESHIFKIAKSTVLEYATKEDLLNNNFVGKTVAIIGASNETWGNTGEYPNAVEMTITDDDVGVELSAYLTYYDVQAGLSLGGHTFTSSEIGTEVTFTPVAGDVGKVIGLANTYYNNDMPVWWYQASKKLGFTPIPVAWSGASMSSHESGTNALKTAHAWHDAQIRKCGIRTPGTMNRTAPDVIIIARGLNDYGHSPYCTITSNYFDNISWSYPTTDDLGDNNYGFLEAIALTIKKLREAYPKAEIMLATMKLAYRTANHANQFPPNNTKNTIVQYSEAIRKASDFFGCHLIEIDKCGITFENGRDNYFIDTGSTTPSHANKAGHTLIAERCIKDMQKIVLKS